MKSQRTEWVLAAFTIVTAVAVWWQYRQPGSTTITMYDFFPLLGLLAFGLMWTHFVMGALRRYWDETKHGRTIYQKGSMWAVLVLILAHPMILWYALWQDGLGLPPMSQYVAYGGENILNAALFFGIIGLNIFLLYELKRWFARKNWWKYIEQLQFVAMVLIFLHALTLGGELAIMWYAALWWVYGATIVLSTAFTLWHDAQQAPNVKGEV